jgi:hypothetical protein
MRRVTAVSTMALVLAVGVPAARAISEWWTPAGAKCPVFDSKEACMKWCAADQSRCGGQAECEFRTGPQETKPDCPAMHSLN